MGVGEWEWEWEWGTENGVRTNEVCLGEGSGHSSNSPNCTDSSLLSLQLQTVLTVVSIKVGGGLGGGTPSGEEGGGVAPRVSPEMNLFTTMRVKVSMARSDILLVLATQVCELRTGSDYGTGLPFIALSVVCACLNMNCT